MANEKEQNKQKANPLSDREIQTIEIRSIEESIKNPLADKAIRTTEKLSQKKDEKLTARRMETS